MEHRPQKMEHRSQKPTKSGGNTPREVARNGGKVHAKGKRTSSHPPRSRVQGISRRNGASMRKSSRVGAGWTEKEQELLSSFPPLEAGKKAEGGAKSGISDPRLFARRRLELP